MVVITKPGARPQLTSAEWAITTTLTSTKGRRVSVYMHMDASPLASATNVLHTAFHRTVPGSSGSVSLEN